MTYNKIRHLELLRRFLDFKNQGKDLYRENRNEYMELLHYRGRLEDSLIWSSEEISTSVSVKEKMKIRTNN